VFLGGVSTMEKNNEPVEVAKVGDEVCIKIENTTGEAPKLYGRHFTDTDPLVSKACLPLYCWLSDCVTRIVVV
jgi:translation initiation factor 5B